MTEVAVTPTIRIGPVEDTQGARLRLQALARGPRGLPGVGGGEVALDPDPANSAEFRDGLLFVAPLQFQSTQW
ncbi:MAG: hypothetical protein AAFY65_13025 [Pseudomonadota bacterium]